MDNSDTATTSPVAPAGVKKKEKKGELGISVFHLETVLQEDVRKFLSEEKEQTGVLACLLCNLYSGKKNDNDVNTVDKDFDEINIYDIVEGVIKAKGANVKCPRDGQIGAAYVDCLKGEDHVGEANIMLSYAWANTVVDIVDVLKQLCALLGIDPKRAYVWICSFCNNQHRFSEEKTLDELQEILKNQVGIGRVVSLMSPYDNPFYCTRAWCVIEFDTAESSGTEAHILLPSREQQKMVDEIISNRDDGYSASQKLFAALRSIKIEDTKASIEQDKINILKLVEKNGGAAKLNMAMNDRLHHWQMGIVKDVSARLETESKDATKDLDLARSLNNTGVIFRDRGYFDDAMESFVKSMNIRETVLGKDHEDTAITYHDIASVYNDQGKYNDALEYYIKALIVREKVFGKDHHYTATTYGNIAMVYYKQGKFEDALEYNMIALTIREKVLGTDHHHTATTYNNIALIHNDQGKYEAALENYMKCLTIEEKVLGKDHQSTAMTYHNIAEFYLKQGKHEDALEYNMKALTIRETVLGKDHQHTATTYNNIAFVYNNQGKYDDALEYYTKCLAIEEKVLGKDNHSTAITYYNIADAYERQGEFYDALQYYKKCLTTLVRLYGTNHEVIQHTMSKILELTNRLKKT